MKQKWWRLLELNQWGKDYCGWKVTEQVTYLPTYLLHGAE
jgi:hypothetical protein